MMGICYFPKIVAFLCGLSVIVLIVVCLGASTWLVSDGFQQGIWYYCIEEMHEKPLPPGIPDKVGCFTKPFKWFIFITGILLTATLFMDFIATTLLAVTMCTTHIGRKTSIFKAARTSFIFSFICCIAGLTLFVVMFAMEYRQWGRRSFEFGWAFGMGWGASIFLFGALLLLCCDRETDTVYYAAKTMEADM